MGRNEGAVKALAHRGVLGLRASMTNDARRAASREAGPDPLDRARHAVAEVQHQADQAHQDRAQQRARWHTDDRAAARQQGLAVTDGAAR